MARPAPRAGHRGDAPAFEAIESFLATAKQPVYQESGELPFPVQPGNHDLSRHGSSALLALWDEERHIQRRIVEAAPETGRRLSLTVERFPKRRASALLYDAAGPAATAAHRQGVRHHLREAFREMLAREFPGWRLERLSADLDLQHSLSANYPRGLLRRGAESIAVLAAPDGPSAGHFALTYALLWLDRLRRTEPQPVHTLALFLPAQALTVTALRLRWLQGAQFRLFVFDAAGHAVEIDPNDCGNLYTELLPARPFGPSFPSAPGPESDLRRCLHASLELADPRLRPDPVYAEVLTITGLDRGAADLVAADRHGRLTVIEIKASEDPHLPIQALDYWIQLTAHTSAGAWSAKGYFPGIPLQSTPPRLLLAAPALAFHPSTETILRYFSSNIAVERIGVGVEWRQRLRVLFRCQGAESP